jgi:hypothetical protein
MLPPYERLLMQRTICTVRVAVAGTTFVSAQAEQ